jgi:hypothetical protein
MGLIKQPQNSNSIARRSLHLPKALGLKSIDLQVGHSPVVLGADVRVLYPLWSRKNGCNVSRCGRLALPEKESQLPGLQAPVGHIIGDD